MTEGIDQNQTKEKYKCSSCEVMYQTTKERFKMRRSRAPEAQ